MNSAASDSGDAVVLKDPPEPKIYPRDRHCISRSSIDADALKIMYRLIRHGHKAFLVGGGVRDLLLQKAPKDFDIATDATPGKVRSLFRNSRIIGRRFKLAHVYFKNHKIIEVSTFRDFSDPSDIQDDVEPEKFIVMRDNKYGNEATDALRRDITINGLFYDLSTFSIIDYVGGMEDLESGLIRVIGDPDVRYREDPVRLMRVVRHAVRAGFRIEENCYQALLRNHEMIALSPPMRLYEELKKDMSSGYLLGILRLLHETKLLGHLLPELSAGEGALLSLEHPFTEVLARIDELCRGEEEVPLTAILSAITLYLKLGAAPEQDPLLQFEDRGEIEEQVSDAFRVLAVPRKERERILETILLAWKLRTTDGTRTRASSLERRRCINDVHWLFRILSLDEDTDEFGSLLALTDEASRLRERAPKKRAQRSDVDAAESGGAAAKRGSRRRGRRGGRRRRQQ